LGKKITNIFGAKKGMERGMSKEKDEDEKLFLKIK